MEEGRRFGSYFRVTPFPLKGECSELGCLEKVRCKGLCRLHYSKEYYNKKKQDKKECTFEDCENLQHKNSVFCFSHYNKLKDSSVCEVFGCKNRVYEEKLCRQHFIKKRGRCVYGICENTNIYCLAKMLCQFHYNSENRKKRRWETVQNESYNLSASLFKNNKRIRQQINTEELPADFKYY